MDNKKDYFLREVTSHIKSKEARQFVTTELKFHLKRAKAAWIEKGLSDADAEEKAVQQMGSPLKLGQEMNKLHRPRVDWVMVILLVIAMGLGFLPIVSLGQHGFDTDFIEMHGFIENKIIIIILSVVVVIGMMLLDYRKLEKFGWLFYILGVLILVMISYFPNLMMNGEPMIIIGPITIKSLMAVPFFFLAWASFFNNGRLKVWQLGILFFFSLFFFFWIPNLSVTFIYCAMVFVMLWWSKLSKKRIFIITTVLIGFVILSVFLFWSNAKEYQLQRILAFLHPEIHADGAYMYIHLQEIMSSAGWFGSSENIEFDIDTYTDLVFASLTYNYGYLFSLFLVLVLSLFVVRILFILNNLQNDYGKLLAIGGITLFVVQFIYNIGMILGFLPLASMSLPFISYGLMPTLLPAFLMGIVLSVYRRKTFISVEYN